MKSIGSSLIFSCEFAEIKLEKKGMVFLYQGENFYILWSKSAGKTDIYQIVYSGLHTS
jgi:hypothetical protein